MEINCPYCSWPLQIEASVDGAVVTCPECGEQSEIHLDAALNLGTGEVLPVALLEPLAKLPL